MSAFEEYAHRCNVAQVERDDGILSVRLHSDGGPLKFGSDNGDSYQLADLFADIAADPENRVMILTGTGDAFSDGVHHFT